MNRVAILALGLVLLTGTALATIDYHVAYDSGSGRHDAVVHYDEQTGSTWVAVDGIPAFLPSNPLPVDLPDGPPLPPVGSMLPPLPEAPEAPELPATPVADPVPLPAPSAPEVPAPAAPEPTLPALPEPSPPVLPEPAPPEAPELPAQDDVVNLAIDVVGGAIENAPSLPVP